MLGFPYLLNTISREVHVFGLKLRKTSKTLLISKNRKINTNTIIEQVITNT